MPAIRLSTPLGFLTRSQELPNVNGDGGTFTRTYTCDAKGKEVAPINALPMYRDDLSGDAYVRLVEKIPSANDSQSVLLAAAINAQNPIHFASPDGHINGYFIVAPDFCGREGK